MRKNKAIAALLLLVASVISGLANVPSRVAFCHGGEAASIKGDTDIVASAIEYKSIERDSELKVNTGEAVDCEDGDKAVGTVCLGQEIEKREIASGRQIGSRFLELIFGGGEESAPAKRARSKERRLLVPVGSAFGVKISGTGVRVTATPDTGAGDDGEFRLLENDRIEKIDGAEVYSTEQVKEILRASGGRCLTLDIQRDGKHIRGQLTPKMLGTEYSLGVIVSDNACGIGTITYIDPKTYDFGGLGHGICDTKTGEVLNMTRGEATTVILGGAVKGASGSPGELRGVLTERVIGEISCNTECGIFGRLNADTAERLCGGAIPFSIAAREQVHEGEATIISTVKNGMAQEFKISIESIDKGSDGTKSFRIKVTDPTLIALTGGIVRGMSGSPIIQDGKLVGAVTHVMVADPTEGYGIFIENMLSAAQNQVQPKAA